MAYYICERKKKGGIKMEYINIIIGELKSKIFNPECTAGEIVDFLRELDEKTLELVRKEVHVLLDENLGRIKLH
jgi:hypothetical protein